MAGSALTREEGWGLAISIAGHAALLALLLLRPASDNVVIPPERVEVTISEDVGMTSASPDLSAKAAPDEAPELGEAAPAPEPEAAPLPPEPAPRVIEPPKPPAPRPVAKPEPKKPEPRKIEARKPEPRKPPVREAARPKPSPPKPSVIDRAARTVSPSSKPAAKPNAAAAAPARATTPPKKPGGSRFAEAFKQGTPGAASASGSGAPAAAIGPQVRASLAQTVLNQVRPHWQGRVPQGLNTDRIVTILTIELMPDGNLARSPQVTSQEGVDDTNRAQAARHAEEAIRAVQLAAPFALPPDQYEAWKKLPPLRFRKNT